MMDARIKQFDKAVILRKESTEAITKYWLEHSLYTSFEFWLLVVLFFIPLVLLIIKIDKKKIFLIGFYGYGIHIFTHYVNLTGINLGLWNFPILLIPTNPSITFDAVVVPVTYMLMFQWTINHHRNYYIYSIITAGFFAFIFEPIMSTMGILRMYDSANFMYRFICFLFIGLISKLISDVFLKLQKLEPIDNL